MDENFKRPSLDNRVKFVSRKSSEKLSNNINEQSSSASNADTNKIVLVTNHQPKQITCKCPYVEPKWSKKPIPEHIYNFEVLKSGTIAETFNNLQTQAFWLIGKLPDNHILMAHPTISRYHAVFQYRPEVKDEADDDKDNNEKQLEPKSSSIEKGWYLYDLNSTHGTFVNKNRIPPKTYVRIRVGYMLKFGGSSRNFILQGPDFDEETESELSITEIKELRRKKEEDHLAFLKAEEKRKEEEGISWGMVEDANEETDLSINPFASTNNEELWLQDPKKTLRGYFEREGHDLDYKVDEMSPGTFLCRIELPISDANGRPLIAEVCHKGKKKECVHQCALEACRLLDRQGVLRQANHESRKRKIKHHSDSDGDDEFYDRTGAVENKKQLRQAGFQTNAQSYDELLQQEQCLLQNLEVVNSKIDKYKNLEKYLKQQSNQDEDVDDFMSHLTNEKQIDKTEIRKLRFEVQRIQNEHSNLKRLINIARPVDLIPLHTETNKVDDTKRNPKLTLFGKRGNMKYGGLSSNSKNVGESQLILQSISGNEKDKEEIELDAEKNATSNDIFQKSPKELEVSKQCATTETGSEKQSTDVCPVIISNSETTTVIKKKRNRIRIRVGKSRENVDFDEDEHDTEKYSSWVPPEGQIGDGNTDLNEKFGY